MNEEIIFIQIYNKQYVHLNDSIHICENIIQYLYYFSEQFFKTKKLGLCVRKLLLNTNDEFC